MPCDRKLRKNQTISQRKEEIRTAVEKLNSALASGKVKPIVGPQGAIAFQGWSEQDRSDVGDVCAYRQLMISGSALARNAIARAEQLAGRKVDRQVVNAGVHSHDFGRTWHTHKG